MLPLSAQETVRFIPSKYPEGDPAAPVYLLGVPTLLGRAVFQRAVTAQGARYVGDAELLEAARGDVRTLVVESQEAELLALLDAWESCQATGGTPDEPLRQKMTALQDTLAQQAGRYTQALADRVYFSTVAPLLAAQLFLKGLEHAPMPLPRRGGLVTEEALAALPHEELLEVGWKALALLFLTKEQEKNSPSPSSSRATPAPSPADANPPTAALDGTCSAPSTPPTPASN